MALSLGGRDAQGDDVFGQISDVVVDELALHAASYTRAENELMDDMRRCIERLTVKDRELLHQRYSVEATCESITWVRGLATCFWK